MSIFGVGTLLTGASGIGKSELALALIDRGHPLIADDAPEFSVNADNQLLGRSPPVLQNLLEIRGAGIFDVAALFGKAAIVEQHVLSLVIELKQITPIPRLVSEPAITAKPILNIPVAHLTLPITPQRRSELLVETLVLYYQQQQPGVTSTLAIAKPLATHRVYPS